MIIVSKVVNAKWDLRYKEQENPFDDQWHKIITGVYEEKKMPVLTQEDIEYIENLSPDIYSNDFSGREWCFDVKLPSGIWLENIDVVYREANAVLEAKIFV